VCSEGDEDELRQRADDAIRSLRSGSDANLEGAKKLVVELRNAGQYEPMGMLAEAISRGDPGDARNRRLYAQ
jgi:hypothetical protein